MNHFTKGGAIVASLLFPPKHHPCNDGFPIPAASSLKVFAKANPSKYFAVPENLLQKWSHCVFP